MLPPSEMVPARHCGHTVADGIGSGEVAVVDGERQAAGAAIMVIRKERGRGGLKGEIPGNARDRVGPMKLPVGPADEAPGRTIEQHTAARPFVILRPERR